MNYLEKWSLAPTTLHERLEKEIEAINDNSSRRSEIRLLARSMRGRDCYAIPGDSFAKKSCREIGLREIPKSPDCLVCKSGKEPPYQFVECKYDISMQSGGVHLQKVSDIYNDLHGKDSSFRHVLGLFALPANDTLFVVFNEEVAPIARAELADWSLENDDESFRFRVFATDDLIEALVKVGVEFF